MDKRFLLLFHLKEKDSKTQQVFIEAMKQNLHYHDKHCLEYHKILKESGCCIDEIHSISDLEKIKNETVIFLNGILQGMKKYYDEKTYLKVVNN